jgi:bis(5'-nucleosyl)-tetraphosphatase (symmetrical)
MRGRRVFVGDIQGCREELERLLEMVAFDPARDRLEPVGDVVNRGPDSAGVLRLLRSMGAGGVLGNHDVHLIRVAAGRRRLNLRDTIQDVLEAPDRDELVGWLRSRPFVRGWADVVLVHAGLHPFWRDPGARLNRLDPAHFHPDSDYAMRVRYCTKTGERPARDHPPPGEPFAPWFAHWEGPRTVVFGHWARLGRVVRPAVRGLDTGCVWGGKLTAWIAEDDRFVQVPAARAYVRPPTGTDG